MENKTQPSVDPAAPQKPASTALIRKELESSVLTHVKEMESSQSLKLPADYSAENAIKSAFLLISELQDKNFKPALEVCTKASIANALINMVTQGLNPSKQQCYFIVYGTKLICQRSYFGAIAIVNRVRPLANEPIANMIREKDVIEFAIDATTGKRVLVKHEQPFENLNNKIIGAYCVLNFKDGTQRLEVMTRNDIEKSWDMSKNKGKVHNNFEADMCARTVIQKACKVILNSSSDANLYESEDQEEDDGKREAFMANREAEKSEIIDIDFEEEPKTPPNNAFLTEKNNEIPF